MTDSNDSLARWVQTFLRGEGKNVAFADGLNLEPRSYFGPVELPLALVSRCCGPEEGMKYRTPQHDFDPRIAGLRSHLQTGGTLPPLIINFSDGRFELNDGNHRHEALVREGRTTSQFIVWTTGEADHQAFLSAFGPWLEADQATREPITGERQPVVGCLIRRPDGRIFAQRRSPSRRTFPGCWDLVGGHVEPGETVLEGLIRELAEETGWQLDRVLGLRRVVDWETSAPDGRPQRRREYVLAVSIQAGWDAPILETGKVTEARWFSAAELEALNENRVGSDTYVYDLVKEELNRPT